MDLKDFATIWPNGRSTENLPEPWEKWLTEMPEFHLTPKQADEIFDRLFEKFRGLVDPKMTTTVI